jgi:hypothetical protein
VVTLAVAWAALLGCIGAGLIHRGRAWFLNPYQKVQNAGPARWLGAGCLLGALYSAAFAVTFVVDPYLTAPGPSVIVYGGLVATLGFYACFMIAGLQYMVGRFTQRQLR